MKSKAELNATRCQALLGPRSRCYWSRYGSTPYCPGHQEDATQLDHAALVAAHEESLRKKSKRKRQPRRL